jgi:hypothetical protein
MYYLATAVSVAQQFMHGVNMPHYVLFAFSSHLSTFGSCESFFSKSYIQFNLDLPTFLLHSDLKRSFLSTKLHHILCQKSVILIHGTVRTWDLKFEFMKKFSTFSLSKFWSLFCTVEREFSTTLVIRSSIFWDITPCCLLKLNQYFGGMSIDFQRTT